MLKENNFCQLMKAQIGEGSTTQPVLRNASRQICDGAWFHISVYFGLGQTAFSDSFNSNWGSEEAETGELIWS